MPQHFLIEPITANRKIAVPAIKNENKSLLKFRNFERIRALYCLKFERRVLLVLGGEMLAASTNLNLVSLFLITI